MRPHGVATAVADISRAETAHGGAGNAIQTVQSTDAKKVITVRTEPRRRRCLGMKDSKVIVAIPIFQVAD